MLVFPWLASPRAMDLPGFPSCFATVAGAWQAGNPDETPWVMRHLFRVSLRTIIRLRNTLSWVPLFLVLRVLNSFSMSSVREVLSRQRCPICDQVWFDAKAKHHAAPLATGHGHHRFARELECWCSTCSSWLPVIRFRLLWKVWGSSQTPSINRPLVLQYPEWNNLHSMERYLVGFQSSAGKDLPIDSENFKLQSLIDAQLNVPC